MGFSCTRVQLHEGSVTRWFRCIVVQLQGGLVTWVFSCKGSSVAGAQLHGGSVARGFSCLGLCYTRVQLQWNRNKLLCRYILIECLIYRAG